MWVVGGVGVLRGIKSAAAGHTFLKPSLEQLHSPYQMRGMAMAIERLSGAIVNKEQILIYGDYDVDGTTAVVILKTAIELCGGAADFHVPHRIKEGYGIKDDVIERAAAAGVKLVISVDTGIRAFQAAETARRAGVDLIVTDHHLPEAHEGVPNALAVLNPNQQGCDYPCKALCGAGVAFKVVQALFAKFKDGAEQAKLIPSSLKMVAIATIADAVPLVDENRIMAKLGLEGLRRPVNGGLKALMEVAGLQSGDRALTAGDVGFRLGPRINAAGRMDVARDVIELFTSKSPDRWREIAEKLNQLNLARQAEEQRIVAAIDEQLATGPDISDKFCLVFDGDGWHRGVVGIVASRGLFTRFGGHAHAVGFALPSASLPELKLRLDAFARGRLTPEDLLPELNIDAEITLKDVTPELFESLRQLEPFGQGNPEAVFASQGVNLVFPPRVIKDKHLKFRVNQTLPDGRGSYNYEAMGWRMAERLAGESYMPGDRLDLAFTVTVNNHPDFGGLELVLEDFRKSTTVAIPVYS